MNPERRRRCARPVTLAVAAGLLLLAAPPVQAAGTAAQRTWHFDQVTVPAARPDGRFGAGVTVAVLDSWVDAAHMDFEGRVLAGADCVGGSCKNGPAKPDKCDHGTHVAGTVASSSFGVAPKARILPVRVLTFDPDSSECIGVPDDVAAGIRWAIGRRVQVINLSLGPDVAGLTTSKAIPTAVKEAAAAGIVVVFSAGNNGDPVTDAYDGNALVVAATGRSGAIASYSQRGAAVDLAAPGGDPKNKDQCSQSDCVTSLFPANRYSVAAGTSMAAPHVAGIAALLLGQDPSRTRSQVFDRLQSTARPLADAGAGLVDASAALGVKAGAPAPSPAPQRPVPVVQGDRPSARPTPPSSPPGSTAAASPSASPSPSASAVVAPPLAVSASPVPLAIESSAPNAAAAPSDGDDDDIPTPLVLVAGGLIAAAGASVLALSRRTPSS